MAMYVNKKRKKVLLISTLALLITVGSWGAYAYFKHANKTEPMTTASPATKGPGTELPSSASGDNPTKGSDTKNSSDQSPKDTTPLEQPTGIFVSNHHPNLSNSPAPNQINSVCNTTSGATCTIVFTKGSVVKSLPPETTDSGGSAYWTWKLQDIGITEGTWKVQAKATLGSQTKIADDLMDLVVNK